MTLGVKDDKGKTQWWYMDNFWEELEEVVQVLTMGDGKYPCPTGDNWKYVENGKQRYKDAALRHIILDRQGEKTDPESGKSHKAHAITNLLFLMYLEKEEVGNYDLATIEKVQEVVENMRDNCTNYSSMYSQESDRRAGNALADGILEDLEEMKGK